MKKKDNKKKSRKRLIVAGVGLAAVVVIVICLEFLKGIFYVPDGNDYLSVSDVSNNCISNEV